MSTIQYTKQEILLVWNKGKIVSGYDTSQYRKDACGAWMVLSHYGNRNSNYGWEIDHIVPLSKNGTHHINNVQPLHWKNNASKSDGPLVCAVWARG